jgi:hypothetical protein
MNESCIRVIPVSMDISRFGRENVQEHSKLGFFGNITKLIFNVYSKVHVGEPPAKRMGEVDQYKTFGSALEHPQGFSLMTRLWSRGSNDDSK